VNPHTQGLDTVIISGELTVRVRLEHEPKNTVRQPLPKPAVKSKKRKKKNEKKIMKKKEKGEKVIY
jgi:hypothetical protein